MSGAGSYTIQGGASVQKSLDALARKAGRGGVVNVGFIDKAKYSARDPRGKPRRAQYFAQVAFWNEFGTTRAPPRPFFRGMIVQQAPTWGEKLAAFMKASDYNVEQSLGLLGEDIRAALIRAIKNWPADNAARTVAIKKFNHGLVDSGDMQRHVGVVVTL